MEGGELHPAASAYIGHVVRLALGELPTVVDHAVHSGLVPGHLCATDNPVSTFSTLGAITTPLSKPLVTTHP